MCKWESDITSCGHKMSWVLLPRERGSFYSATSYCSAGRQRSLLCMSLTGNGVCPFISQVSIRLIWIKPWMQIVCQWHTPSIPRLQRWEFKSFFCQILNTIWNIGWFNLVSIIWIMTDCYPLILGQGKLQHINTKFCKLYAGIQ